MAAPDPAATLRRWLPFRKASPGCRVRLFCLPFAGGGASVYRAWEQGLPGWLEVCAVQLAGRETRFAEEPVSDLPQLIEQLDAALAPLLDDGTPFALYGHSVGGAIAFELARLRARRGATRPLHVFVGGSARTRAADEPLVSEMDRAGLVDALRRWGGTHAELFESPEALDLILRVFRADNALFERYQPVMSDRIDLPLTAFVGADDPSVTEQDLRVWAESCASFRSRVLPGDHFFAFPSNAQLLAELADTLAQATKPRTSDQKLAGMSEQKRALVSALLRQRRGDAADWEPIAPRERTDAPVPLSYPQQQMWFLYQLEPDSPFYNICNAIELRGRLNVPALTRAIQAIVARHEILRTTYHEQDGSPIQTVRGDLGFAVTLEDLTHLPDPRAEAMRRCAADAQTMFDLGKEIIRARLYKLADDVHILYWNIHHIASDAGSAAIILREIRALYPAFAAGEPDPLPPLGLQHSDIAVWQRSAAHEQRLARQLEYWKQKLAGEVEILDLPTDRVRPPVPSYRGDHVGRMLSVEKNAEIAAFAKAEGTTPYVIWLAAFYTVLHRYSGKDDLVIGTTVSSRNRVEIEGNVGFLTNTVALRTSFGGNPSFREAVRRSKETILEAQSNHEVPFERVVEALRPARQGSVNPFYQVMFTFDNHVRVDRFSLPGLQAAPAMVHSGAVKFELELEVLDLQDSPELMLEYNSDLFLRSTAERILQYVEAVVTSGIRTPDASVLALDMLSAEEQRRILIEWNRSEAAFPEHATLHGLIEQQADADPDAPAVIFEGATLSRGELERRANQLAHLLRELGIGRNVPVGISIERSFELVVGLVAIAKAGGAYLPLDPTYPLERLQFMQADAGAPVLLTQEHLAPRFAGFTGTSGAAGTAGTILCLDRDAPTIAARPATRCEPLAGAADLAYVIYTSASTGRPKCVMVDHRGRVNNLGDINRRYGVGPGDRLIALNSVSFDLTAYDVFGTLMAGAAIVLPRPELERDPAHWADLMVRHRVSVWQSAPAMLGLLVDHLENNPREPRPDAWRLVLLGGDWIPVALPDRVKALAPGIHIVSMGGATEVSVHSTIHDVVRTEATWKSIPYGVPMANQLAYVLDRRGLPTPVGIPGELYLGGVGVGWGYRGRPDLTAEKFVPNPFTQIPGDRMYRTGDLARYGADGEIELLGRIDFQTKIRGFRIELGEIEAALRSAPVIEAALVVARQDPGQPKQLVAYLVCKRGQAAAYAEADLRALLGKRLPDYMIPSAFVVLEAFPLTPNGKIDRRALPAPAPAGADAPHEAPSTPQEEALAAIWRELTGREQVSARDNFFAVGGDSVRAIQMVSRLRARGLRVAPKQIFHHPTLRELAAVLEQADLPADPSLRADAKIPPAQLEALRREHPDVVAIYRLGPMQTHMLSELRRRPRPGLYVNHNSVMLPGDVDARRLHDAWSWVASRHEVLRASYVTEGVEVPVQLIHAQAEIPLHEEDWRGIDPAEQRARLDRYLREERTRGFDTGRAPLMRLFLFRLSDEVAVLGQLSLYTLLDGWSHTLLRKELLHIYQASRDGEALDLPEVPSYGNFVAWTWAQDRDASLAYWKRYLAGVAGGGPLARLGQGASRETAGHIEDYTRISATLGEGDLARLRQLAVDRGLTLATLLIGAWALVLLEHAAPGEDAVFAVTTSARPPELPGVDDMVGLVLNSIPVRAGRPDAGEDLPAWLRRLQAARLESSAHEQLPLTEIYAACGLDPDRAIGSVLVLDNYPVYEPLGAVSVHGRHPTVDEDVWTTQQEFPLRIDMAMSERLVVDFSFYRSELPPDAAAALQRELIAALARLALHERARP